MDRWQTNDGGCRTDSSEGKDTGYHDLLSLRHHQVLDDESWQNAVDPVSDDVKNTDGIGEAAHVVP